MKRSFKCLPQCDLPYDNDKAATRMIVKLFEEVPFIANLPHAAKDDTVVKRTLNNIPGVVFKKNQAVFDDLAQDVKQWIVNLDAAFNNPTPENIAQFAFDSYFLSKYYQIIERIKPAETVVNLLGPFSASLMLTTKDGEKFIADKLYRKLIVQVVTLKALWIINKIKELSPETKPLIMFEEPMLNKAGDVRREFESITQDVIVNNLSKVFAKIKEAGADSGIQCFEKCNWQIPIDAGVDLISFDAYNNPNNLNIIPDKINEFLAKGGKINWAIVPTKNEAFVKSLSFDYIYDRFIKTVEGFILAGGNSTLAYNNALVSIQGSVKELPLIFAEKALILGTQVAKKIPVVH